ncbi:aminotransferase class V-fold PLP-dependent enzyme [Kitasatospora sp. NPDC052896]|uniref:aminotransferase class V-fold PLP-dependent enzyme n=1 Tax=Kitasatospora sp. NPDC052896 TaxID=3364061 RepID=UPI0037C905A5
MLLEPRSTDRAAGTGAVHSLLAELGVEPLIHCGGTKTTMGGSRTDPEVRDVMWAASDVFVPVAELNAAVGRFIAGATGAEAAMVTSGAASGCVLSLAACMTGTDPARVAALPNPVGMRDEMVLMRTHVGRYTHMYRQTGARVVEVGTMNECHLWEILSAVNERTAAIGWLEGPGIRQVGPDFATVCREAHELGIPVIVDAAAMLPPRANLRRYLDQGADLVAISGGKVIRGPQNTGLLYGRRDLIEAARANNGPNQAIGRAHKVTREDMLGLYVALKRYLGADEDAELAYWRELLAPVHDTLSHLPGADLAVLHDEYRHHVPTLVLGRIREVFGRRPSEVAAALLAGVPRIFVPADDSRDELTVNPVSLAEDQVAVVAERIRAELTALAA